MVITIEPGLYISAAAEVAEEYRGIGIRIEDDILVTDSGHEVLTSGVAKEVSEVEALCSGRGAK
jgi:Xaa-Pro aminopeptidase